MHCRKLGRSDLSVSTICQGSWAIATKDFFWDGQDRADSLATIARRSRRGHQFLRYEPAYGDGESEEILGEALGARIANGTADSAGMSFIASSLCE